MPRCREPLRPERAGFPYPGSAHVADVPEAGAATHFAGFFCTVNRDLHKADQDPCHN